MLVLLLVVIDVTIVVKEAKVERTTHKYVVLRAVSFYKTKNHQLEEKREKRDTTLLFLGINFSSPPKGGAAKRAGLVIGDQILSVNGRALDSVRHFVNDCVTTDVHL